MEKFKIKYFIFSIVSGILLAITFQKINAFWLAFAALVPIINTVLKNSVKKSLVYGFLFGFVFWFVSLYWMYPFVKFNTGGIQAAAVSVLLWFYLSLYFVVWAVFLSFSKRRFKPVILSFFSASLWTALEFARSYLLTGFGWNLLGYSQASFIYFIQISDIAGVYGVSFVIVFINMLIYYQLRYVKESKYIYFVLLTFLFTIIYGYIKTYKFYTDYGEEFKAGIVQPNVDIYKKWDKKYNNEILENIKDSVGKFENEGLDITVYPETVLTEYFENDKKTAQFIKDISRFGEVNLIGSLTYDGTKIYNSVYALGRDFSVKARRDKVHLVPFGEFIPFRNYLSKYFEIFDSMGDFNKGSELPVFKYGRLAVGATICSENFFADISRKLVLNGAKILTNHTNDGWFLNTDAPYQHFVMNVFRAVENRKNVIVSANTGISAVIDCCGNVVKGTLPDEKSVLICSVYQNNDITIYDKIGYKFVYFCVFMSILMLLILFI